VRDMSGKAMKVKIKYNINGGQFKINRHERTQQWFYHQGNLHTDSAAFDHHLHQVTHNSELQIQFPNYCFFQKNCNHLCNSSLGGHQPKNIGHQLST
uniref:Uncharacterized protein n=1 Tax=Amphiprion percula TaxID=161767 RepID=A0A3P8U3D9_AMPPE